MTTKRNSLPHWTIQTTLHERTGMFVLVNLWVSRAAATKQSTITMTIPDESHWSIFRRWLLLFHWHTPCLWRKCLGWFVGTVAELLLIGRDHCTHFLQLAGDPWSLSSYQEPSQRDENPAVELCKILYLWRDSYLSTDQSWITRDPLHTGQIFQLEGQILPAVDWMRCVKMIRGDNSGDSSSFAAKLSPWSTGGGKP